MATETNIQTQVWDVFRYLLDLLRQTPQRHHDAAGAAFRHTGDQDDPGMFMLLDSCLYSAYFGEHNDKGCSMNMRIVGRHVLFSLQLPAQYNGSKAQALSLFLHDLVKQLRASPAYRKHSRRGIVLTPLLGSR